jgi:hypothetical protein
MTTKKKRFLNHLLVFLTILTITIVSCEKKVYAPGVEDQNTTSSSTTSSSTTSSSTTSGTTGSTTSGTTGSTTGTTGGTTRTLTFWSNFNGAPISVSVNGVYKGQISSYYSTSPSCNASGCVSIPFSSTGSYSYSATDGTYTWSGSGTITSTCNTMLLHI